MPLLLFCIAAIIYFAASPPHCLSFSSPPYAFLARLMLATLLRFSLLPCRHIADYDA